MVDIVCLECALAFRNDMVDIVTAEGNDAIVFPHVDSCVAVVFLHAGGKATGGHVSVVAASETVGEEASLTEMLGRMKDWAGTPVQRVILIGHPAWRSVAKKVLAADQVLKDVPCSDHCRFNDPIDVFIELGTQKLRVQAWQSELGRDVTAAPARRDDWLLDEAL